MARQLATIPSRISAIRTCAIPAPIRALELHIQTEAGGTFPTEGIIRRRASGCLEGDLNALILSRVSLDQGNAQTDVDVSRAHMYRTTGAWIKDEKARDRTANEDGVEMTTKCRRSWSRTCVSPIFFRSRVHVTRATRRAGFLKRCCSEALRKLASPSAFCWSG